MGKKLFCRFKKNNRGAAAIEFALVLPILVFLVMGILEYGWLLNGSIAIRSAAREGARVVSAFKELDDTAYIREAVVNHVDSPFIFDVDGKIIDDNYETKNPKSTGVTVQATGKMKPLVGFYVRTEYYQLVGEATMRID